MSSKKVTLYHTTPLISYHAVSFELISCMLFFRQDPCSGDACGPNADCRQSGARALCECRRGYIGSPYSRSGCRANPCVEGVCGAGAECKDVGGRPVCECLPGYQVT